MNVGDNRAFIFKNVHVFFIEKFVKINLVYQFINSIQNVSSKIEQKQ